MKNIRNLTDYKLKTGEQKNSAVFISILTYLLHNKSLRNNLHDAVGLSP
jgi:hypothetical protein